MNSALLAAVALAGGVGAVVRFLVDGAVRGLVGERLPWGTMLINATGSLLLGFVTGAVTTPLPAWAVVVGSGLLGGYTTFSTASLETVRLLQQRRFGASLTTAVGQPAVAVVLAALGLALGRAI